MSVATDVLRRLDPRKSYDRGAWTARGEVTQSAPLGSMPATALASVSTADLRRELERRANTLEQLYAKREEIVVRLAGVENDIARLSGSASSEAAERKPARRVGPRLQNSLTLRDAIAACVEPGQHVTPAGLTDLVRQGGYVTTNLGSCRPSPSR